MGSTPPRASSDGGFLNRRGFLRAGGLGAAGLTLRQTELLRAAAGSDERAVILLMLVGGPSQLDSWDPKPDAPTDIRGPFRAISTAVPGVYVTEYLPRAAARMDRLTLVRSIHHDAAPIHETGHQLLQTGGLCRFGHEAPHAGAVVSALLGPRHGVPAAVLLPGPIGNTGVGVAHGQSAGSLGADHELLVPNGVGKFAAVCDLRRETARTRHAYGPTEFGRNCLLARRCVEAGARFVTVNMFQSVFHEPTWDCHGAAPFSTLDDCARVVMPAFDQAFAALLDDLEQRGRLESTLVVATGEFGRTPRLNASGGRDHWPGVWTAVFAGGGTQGGQVVGASDPDGAFPADRPVHAADLVATMYHSLGIDHREALIVASGDRRSAPAALTPVFELFG